MKNKILGLLLIMLFVFGSISSVQAASVIPQKDANVTVSVHAEDDEECDETELIKRFSLRDKFKKSPENQIRDFFNDAEKEFTNMKKERPKRHYWCTLQNIRSVRLWF